MLQSFKSIIELLRAFPDEQACISYLENQRWEGCVVSPFSLTSKVYKCKNNRYKCLETNKYFNARTQTIFEGSKLPLQKWFLAIYLISTSKRGLSSYLLAQELNITQKSSWFVLSRIRYAMEHETFLTEMSGTIQLDETFIGGKNKNRHHDKKVQNSQGRSFKDKTPILGIMNEVGGIKCFVMKDTKGTSIQPLVRQNVAEGSILVTDEWQGYRGLNNGYYHTFVDHKSGQYVNDTGFTTNNVECAWSHLKRMITGTYYKVSPKHLQAYANEFAFRYCSKNDTTNERFNLLLKGANNKRLTYNNLVRK